MRWYGTIHIIHSHIYEEAKRPCKIALWTEYAFFPESVSAIRDTTYMLVPSDFYQRICSRDQ